MSAAFDPRVERAFAGAVGLEGEERAAFVRRACDGESALEREVLGLLEEHDRAGDFLSTPSGEEPPRLEEGGIDGCYRILRELGSGGMGTVYLAEQLRPVRRTVALKVMHRGLRSAEALRRFDIERQALALMEHASVARIFDSGATADGRPFFAMEYVPGAAVTDYCRWRDLPLRERICLMVAVSRAVHHAHQKGVIHRDLKPSNLLVMEEDGHPLPKVIDFGLAKAELPEDGEPGLTSPGELLGTLEYMSPEQAAGPAAAVDARSDIYSLGAVLYELITDTLPLALSSGRTEGLAAALRTIQEVDPPPPSDRLEARAAQAQGPARSALRARARRARGDLDWVVGKAMEKDPSLRYASASELADDLSRFLEREPVSVGPPGASYRLRKLLARHRTVMLGVAGVFLALAAGLVTAVFLYLEAARQRDRALAAERQLAASFAQALQFAGESTSIIADMLSELPGGVRARLELAQRGLEQLEQIAQLPSGRRLAYWGLGYAHQRLGEANAVLGRSADALACYRRSLEFREQDLRENPSVNSRRALAVGHWGVAEGLFLAGDLAGSRVHNRAAADRLLALNTDGVLSAESQGVYLGIAYRRLAEVDALEGRPGDAAENLQRSIELFDRGLAASPAHPPLRRGKTQALRGLAEVLIASGRAEEAPPLLEEALGTIAASARTAGAANLWERTHEARCRIVLAEARRERGEAGEAVESASRAADLARGLAAADPDNFDSRHLLARSWIALGRARIAARRPAEALAALHGAVERLEELARRDPGQVWIRRDLAVACTLAGRTGALDGAAPPGGEPAPAGTKAEGRDAHAFRERALELLRELRAAGKLPPPDLHWIEENEAALAASRGGTKRPAGEP